ncbi:unnamed protein product [Peniophora sp. CBMAI 1063]|nr:unnamed protein product [Peniophora sp. CBMAI 1063]
MYPNDTSDLEHVIKTRLRALFPFAGRITHLFIERLPSYGAATPSQTANKAVFSLFTAVHTLHVSGYDGVSTSAEAPGGSLYPLLGSLQDPGLPSLENLHIDYPRVMFHDWWLRLAVALASRERAGIPLSIVRIYHKWSPNGSRPEGATLSLLETLHEQQGVGLLAPDTFIANALPRAFGADGTSFWTKERVKSVAKSLFNRAVQTIEVEDSAVDSKPVLLFKV